MKDSYLAGVVPSIVCVVFVILFLCKKGHCKKLERSIKECHDTIDALKERISTLEPSKEFSEQWKNAPEILNENSAMSEQLAQVSEELAQVSALLYDKHEWDFSVKRYAYSEDLFALPDSSTGKKLEDAKALCEVLVNNGSAVEPLFSDTEIPKGGAALLLSAFNGYADTLIDSLSSRTNYEKAANKMNLAFFMTNERGKHAVGAVISKHYLEAKLNVLRCTQAFNEYTRILREEEKNRRDAEKEDIKRLQELRKKEREIEQQEAMYERALAQVRAQLSGSISYQEKLALEKHIKDLEAELVAARDAKRALTAAQSGRKGYVYVLSNIGSFGEGVYKIGMTRRLDPMERVRELNIASTPFPFDVHAFIATDDAPALETELHKLYDEKKLNMTTSLNEREFYRIDLDELRGIIEKKGLKANWKMEPSAEEYYESQKMRLLLKSGKKIEKPTPVQADTPNIMTNVMADNSGRSENFQEEYQSIDSFMESLIENRIDYVDKRNVGGNLWIPSNAETDRLLENVTVGRKKLYKVKSAKALRGEPGWFIR